MSTGRVDSPSATATPGYLRGVALVLLAGVCWSSMGLGIRLLEEASPWQLLFYRSLSLTAFLIVFIALRNGGRVAPTFRLAGRSAALGGLALVAAFSGGVVAIVETTVANAMFLFATAPFFAAVLGRLLLGEPVRRATWIAMSVATLGIVVMVAEAISFGAILGNLAAVISALGFAFFTIALRWGRNGDMLPAVVYAGLYTVVFAGGICLATGQGLAVPAGDLGIALGMGTFQVGAGLACYTLGSKAVPAAELALLSMTEVVLGPIWVWLALGEVAGPFTLAGGALLMVAIAGNALSGLRHRPLPPAIP